MERQLVLVVEDHPGIREMFEIVLEEELDVHAVFASEATQALQRARDLRPALVIVDSLGRQPNNGPWIVRKLKSDPATARIPVLGIAPVIEERRKAIEAGCDDCIEKPFDLDLFIRKVRGLLPGLRERALGA